MLHFAHLSTILNISKQINKKEHRDIPRAEDNENKTLDKDELSSLVYVEENERVNINMP
jgi:hypothetical protein